MNNKIKITAVGLKISLWITNINIVLNTTRRRDMYEFWWSV